jgi:hypothetical protein
MKKVLPLLFAIILTGAGCLPFWGGPEPTEQEAEPTETGIPPAISMTANGSVVAGLEGSYCYTSGCVDKIAPSEMVAESTLGFTPVSGTILFSNDETVQVMTVGLLSPFGEVVIGSDATLGRDDNGNFVYNPSTTLSGDYIIVVQAQFVEGGDVSYNFPVHFGETAEVFADPAGRFSFSHDSSFQIVSDAGLLEPYRVLPDIAVGLKSEQASYHPMNYSQDEWFVVSTSDSDEESCLNFDSETTTDTTINGVAFSKTERSDAGAGNRYDTTIYRSHRDGTCYEIQTTLHYASDFTDVDQGAMDESQAEANAMLQEAVDSFRFE